MCIRIWCLSDTIMLPLYTPPSAPPVPAITCVNTEHIPCTCLHHHGCPTLQRRCMSTHHVYWLSLQRSTTYAHHCCDEWHTTTTLRSPAHCIIERLEGLSPSCSTTCGRAAAPLRGRRHEPHDTTLGTANTTPPEVVQAELEWM